MCLSIAFNNETSHQPRNFWFKGIFENEDEAIEKACDGVVDDDDEVEEGDEMLFEDELIFRWKG